MHATREAPSSSELQQARSPQSRIARSLPEEAFLGPDPTLPLLTMATPELAIAKATLSATLFRADPTSLSRPAVDAFFPLVTSALAQCSRPNVQVCSIA